MSLYYFVIATFSIVSKFVLTRERMLQVAETKARSMEEEVSKLQKCLLDKDEQLCATRRSTEHVRSSFNSPFVAALPFFSSEFLFHEELHKFVFDINS